MTGNAKPDSLNFWRVLLVGLLFIGATGACDNFSCQSSEPKSSTTSAQVEASWARHAHISAHIPATARSVFFSRDLATTTEAFGFIDERLPVDGVSVIRQTWNRSAGFDPFDSASLTKIGLDPSAPTAVYYDRGYWVFAAEVKDAELLGAFVEGFGAAPSENKQAEGTEISAKGDSASERFVVERADGALRLSSPGEGSDSLGWLGVDNNTLLAAVRVETLSINEDDTGLPSTWLAASKRPRFVADAANQKLLRELTPQGAVVGIVRPAAWMADIKASGHADTLLKRLLSQVGPIGVAANSMSLDEGVRLRVLVPGNPTAPAMITSLGQAEGPLAAPDGLVEPGVLAVARLSLDPRKLYELFVSLLPADQRDEVATFWEELDRELSINALRDVLDNLRGHAVLVAYGLDPNALNRDPADAQPWFLRTLKLESTREAVLLPIKEREPLELVLDALTTVSKGKLSRQVAGLTIQCAWMVDGELQWAVILGDEHLIFVDSAVAFEHARAFERGVRPMGAEFEKIGISRLFGPDESAGLYLDTASLGGILSEKSDDDAHAQSLAWLNALSSVVITTREDGPVSTTDAYLRIAPLSRGTEAVGAEGAP